MHARQHSVQEQCHFTHVCRAGRCGTARSAASQSRRGRTTAKCANAVCSGDAHPLCTSHMSPEVVLSDRSRRPLHLLVVCLSMTAQMQICIPGLAHLSKAIKALIGCHCVLVHTASHVSSRVLQDGSSLSLDRQLCGPWELQVLPAVLDMCAPSSRVNSCFTRCFHAA